MTTRRRRNKIDQASDVLRALLRNQETKAEKLHLLWEDAQTEVNKTRRALEALEALGHVKVVMPTPPTGEGSYPTLTDIVVAEATAVDSQTVPSNPRLHSQRINDVWDPKEGSVTVHTALMYTREKMCEWCRKGVPFATEKRTEHYVVTSDPKGVERGFSYEPCTGAVGKETHEHRRETVPG